MNEADRSVTDKRRRLDLALLIAATVGAAFLAWAAVDWVDYSRFVLSVLRS